MDNLNQDLLNAVRESGATQEQIANAARGMFKHSGVTLEEAGRALSDPKLIEALKEANEKLFPWLNMFKHTMPYPRRRYLELHFKQQPLSLVERAEKQWVAFLMSLLKV